MPKETLSASKIKTLKACSWQYWCKYNLKLPDKTNSGALKGDTVHIVLECLGAKRHKHNYNKIIKGKKTFASKSVKRLILKHIKRKQLNSKEDLDDICEMILKGLYYDFFGTKNGEPSEIISEKDFVRIMNRVFGELYLASIIPINIAYMFFKTLSNSTPLTSVV